MKLLCVVRDPINAVFNMTPNNCFLRLREIPENSFFNLFRCPKYEQHWGCCGESCQDFCYGKYFFLWGKFKKKIKLKSLNQN